MKPALLLLALAMLGAMGCAHKPPVSHYPWIDHGCQRWDPHALGDCAHRDTTGGRR